MKLKRGIILCILLGAGLSSNVQAQKFKRFLLRTDSLLAARYRRSNIDTSYIIRPQTNWTLTGRINVSGATLRDEGRQEGMAFKSEMTADYKSTISVGVNYLGIAISLALNPAKLMGKYKDYELNLCKYGNRWGIEGIYQDARDFTGWYEDEGKPRLDLPPEVIRLRSLNLSAYYAFNHRRFSYPAALSQSFIQRRSAGSFMVALAGQGQHVETNAEYSEYKSKLKVINIGVGGGYGYNWVPGRNWLLHISALPTLIVYSHTSLTVNDERIPLKYHFPEFIVTSRAAVVRHFDRWFVGATMVFNFTSIGNSDKLAIYNNKWRARLIVGYRL